MLNEWSLTLTKLCSSKDHYPRESGNENNEIFISKCEFQTWCTKRQHILLSQISKFSCKNVGFEIVCSYYHLVSLLEQCQKIVQYPVFSWVYPRTFVLWVAYPKFKCLFPRSKKKKNVSDYKKTNNKVLWKVQIPNLVSIAASVSLCCLRKSVNWNVS